MALLFESDDVIRDKVEHSVFAGSTNEGLAGGLASLLGTRCTSNLCFCDCKCKNEIVLLGEMWTFCKECVPLTSLYRIPAQSIKYTFKLNYKGELMNGETCVLCDRNAPGCFRLGRL